MKKIKFTYLLVSTFLSRYFGRRYFVVIGAAFLIALLLWFLGDKYNHRAAVSEGIVGIYTNTNLPPTVANLLSQSLVTLDKNDYPKPKLAASWQMNNDATIYTFKLKDNLYWNDGTKVKASDIKFHLPDVEVSYPNDQTISFKLADSFSPFPGLLTNPIFKNNSLVGIGKYKVSYQEMSKNLVAKLVLTPTKNGEGEKLPIITIRFYPDERIAETAFALGEVDSLVGLTSGTDLQNQPSVKIKQITNFNKLVAIFYNTKDPILSDKNLRKSLNFATPKVEGQERAKTSIPAYSWAFNEDLKDSLGDMDMAKNYLDKVDKIDAITLTTTPSLAKLGDQVIRAWKELGVSAVLRVESGSPQNFQALLFAQSIPSDPDQYTLWHSTQTQTNISHYETNKRADKDLEDGRKTADLDKRKEKYLDFQKVLADDVPATFLYFPKSLVIYRNKAEKNLNQVLPIQFPQI